MGDPGITPSSVNGGTRTPRVTNSGMSQKSKRSTNMTPNNDPAAQRIHCRRVSTEDAELLIGLMRKAATHRNPSTSSEEGSDTSSVGRSGGVRRPSSVASSISRTSPITSTRVLTPPNSDNSDTSSNTSNASNATNSTHNPTKNTASVNVTSTHYNNHNATGNNTKSTNSNNKSGGRRLSLPAVLDGFNSSLPSTSTSTSTPPSRLTATSTSTSATSAALSASNIVANPKLRPDTSTTHATPTSTPTLTPLSRLASTFESTSTLASTSTTTSTKTPTSTSTATPFTAAIVTTTTANKTPLKTTKSSLPLQKRGPKKKRVRYKPSNTNKTSSSTGARASSTSVSSASTSTLPATNTQCVPFRSTVPPPLIALSSSSSSSSSSALALSSPSSTTINPLSVPFTSLSRDSFLLVEDRDPDSPEENDCEVGGAGTIGKKLARNRLAAKRCRERKKQYIHYLEQRIVYLERSNKQLIREFLLCQDVAQTSTKGPAS